MFHFYHIRLLDVAACNEVSWHCSVSLQKSCSANFSAAGFDAALLKVYNVILLLNSGAVVLCCYNGTVLQCCVVLLLQCFVVLVLQYCSAMLFLCCRAMKL